MNPISPIERRFEEYIERELNSLKFCFKKIIKITIANYILFEMKFMIL